MILLCVQIFDPLFFSVWKKNPADLSYPDFIIPRKLDITLNFVSEKRINYEYFVV